MSESVTWWDQRPSAHFQSLRNSIYGRVSPVGVQGLHRVGPLGHGGSGPVPPRPPQCCSHLRSASKVPEEPAAVLSDPEQGERLFSRLASTCKLCTHPSWFHVRVFTAGQLLQGLPVEDLPGYDFKKAAPCSQPRNSAHLRGRRVIKHQNESVPELKIQSEKSICSTHISPHRQTTVTVCQRLNKQPIQSRVLF